MYPLTARKTIPRENARAICERALSGERQEAIAAEYNIKRSMVSAIKNGRAYAGFTADIRHIVTSRLR